MKNENSPIPQVPQEITLHYDVPCRLKDGSVLYADIARPAGAGRWPVMLTRTPYNKAQASAVMIDLATTARLGYVAIVQDTRNRGVSTGEGEFVPWLHEADDGSETVAWAASLPYSNGQVFMTGASYLGFTQWAAASRQPPALCGINPIMAPGYHRGSMIYRGGVVELEANAFWWTMMGFEMLMRRKWENPADMQSALASHMAIFDSFWKNGGLESLPLGEFGPLAQGPLADIILGLFQEDHTGPNMTATANTQRYENISIPALVVGGWYDFFIQSTIDQFVGMRARAATPEARDRTRLIVGPWGHQPPWGNLTGEVASAMSGAITALDPNGASGLAARYYTGLQADPDGTAPVKIWVMGAEVWRDEQEWPIARTQIVPWYLDSGGDARSSRGDGVISPEQPTGGSDDFAYDPANPVPTRGGSVLGITNVTGSRDQHAIEARDDVLVYTSSALADDMEVTGTPVMELWATTDVVDTDFVARLVDVHPDGRAMLVTDGIIRARYRNDPDSFQCAPPLEPGQPTLFRIKLLPTSYQFKKGHSLRVDVTSSCFPRWARNLNIWDEWGGTLADAKIAHQRVLHDAAHPSRIMLPIIPS